MNLVGLLRNYSIILCFMRYSEVAKYTVTAEHSNVIVLILVDHVLKVIRWIQISLERRGRLQGCGPVTYSWYYLSLFHK